MELEAVRKCVRAQFEREVTQVSELLSALSIPLTAEELLQFSGLSLSSYTVKGKYSYIKLIAVKTGDRTTKVEGWRLQKVGEKKVRERWLRREMVHLKNFHKTEENRKNLKLLLHYWRRAKALKSWLEEIEEGRASSLWPSDIFQSREE